MDEDDEETDISIINPVAQILDKTANGEVTVYPQYFMFRGAIPKALSETMPTASHHALRLAYIDLKKRFDSMQEKYEHFRRQSPQQHWTKHGSDFHLPSADLRTKDSTQPTCHMTNGVSHDAVGTPVMSSQSPVPSGTKTGKSLQLQLMEQEEVITSLKKEVADLRLTIAGRQTRECAKGGSPEEFVNNLIKQLQMMRRQLQQQTEILQRLLSRQGTKKTYKRRSISGLQLPASRAVCDTDNTFFESVDEEDNYVMPNNRFNDDLYGMPTLQADMASLQALTREGMDGNWVELSTQGAMSGAPEATGGDAGAQAAGGVAVGNQHRRGALPPRPHLDIEYNVGTGPTKSNHDNVGLSVNFDTPVHEQRKQAVVLNNDPLVGHKPMTSHRNIYQAGATEDKVTTPVEAPTTIECPVCSQQFDILQNSPEFQHHVEECLQNGSSPEYSPRTCPLCREEFPATASQTEYEMHVNSHFDGEDIVDRFQILDFE